MPRGGKRPGAGAPKGNINGLKHGRYSPRVQAAFDTLARNDDTRRRFARLLFHARRPATTRAGRKKLRDLVAAGNVVNEDGDLLLNTPYYERVEHARKLRADIRRLRAQIQRTLDRDDSWRDLMADPALEPPPSRRARAQARAPVPPDLMPHGSRPTTHLCPSACICGSDAPAVNQTACSDPNLAQSNSDAWRRLAAIKCRIDVIIDERERTGAFVPVLDEPLPELGARAAALAPRHHGGPEPGRHASRPRILAPSNRDAARAGAAGGTDMTATPTSILDEFRLQARAAFAWLEATVGDVTAEQAVWQPPGRANTIAGTYAHIVRNIDEDINQRLFRRPMLNEGPWKGRTGLVPGRTDWEQGDQVDWQALRAYGRAMSDFAITTVDAMIAEDLALVADLSTPDIAVWHGHDIIRLTVCYHVRLHGGEIACLKGIQGARGYRSGMDTNKP